MTTLRSYPVGATLFYGGLRWQAVLGNNEKQLLRHAVQQGHSHSVSTGETLKSMGFAQPMQQHTQPLLPSHSAAACYAKAKRQQGPHAILLQSAHQNYYWLIAVSNGMVLIKGDQFYDELHDAERAMQQLRHSMPNLQVEGDKEIFTFLLELEAYATADTALKPILARRRRASGYGVVMVLLLGLMAAWWWIAPKTSVPAPHKVVLPVVRVPLHEHALVNLSAFWRNLPVYADSHMVWQQAVCTYSKTQQWLCQLSVVQPVSTAVHQQLVEQGWLLQRQSTQQKVYEQTVESEHSLERGSSLMPLTDKNHFYQQYFEEYAAYLKVDTPASERLDTKAEQVAEVRKVPQSGEAFHSFIPLRHLHKLEALAPYVVLSSIHLRAYDQAHSYAEQSAHLWVEVVGELL